ncbi:Dabb family protein [Puniceibacterium sediminis]|uniref:Stress responsive A/B Barrel Domain n=1 Tax=Puniceibacterium sediminis TaxID=1608407 RepID=A0A238XNL3_9RHOB|nr:Dabb family protein [Puniceibacterium sediminis]SNR60043.1 Stress responsive A/B Barrel Domain [Puniceibacterium sediminis]
MIRHIVLLNLPPRHDKAILLEALELLDGLQGKVLGLLAFDHGPNADYEGKTPDYPYGFVVTFTDRTAHLAYEAHPDHIRAGGMLVSICAGGYDGILVADLVIKAA